MIRVYHFHFGYLLRGGKGVLHNTSTIQYPVI